MGMDYAEFRRHLGKAGLSVKAFAELIGQTPNSISNYASLGAVPTHLAIIAALMGELAEGGRDFRETLRKLDIESVRRASVVGRGFRGSPQIALSLVSNNTGNNT